MPAMRRWWSRSARARQRDSLFGELEPEVVIRQARAARAEARIVELNAEVADFNRRLIDAQRRLDAIEGSRMWRWSRAPSRVYHRLRPVKRPQPRQ